MKNSLNAIALSVGLCLLLPSIGRGQNPFFNVCGTTGDDYSVKVIELRNGDFIFVGGSDGYDFENVVMRFSKNGKKLWFSNFGFHGMAMGSAIEDLIEIPGEGILVVGSADLWNWGNPLYTLFDYDGNVVSDTAYLFPTKEEYGYITVLAFNESKNTVVGFGVHKGNNIKNVWMQTYRDNRLSPMMNYPVVNARTIGAVYSELRKSFSVVCDSANTMVYMLNIDSSGQMTSYKAMYEHRNTYSLTRNEFDWSANREHYVCLRDSFPSQDGKGRGVAIYTADGDSITGRFMKGYPKFDAVLCADSGQILLLGERSVKLDSNLAIIDSNYRYSTPLIDSMQVTSLGVSKENRVYGSGDYFSRLSGVFGDRSDFAFFYNGYDGAFSDTVNKIIIHVGIDDPEKQNGPNILVFPQPANTWLELNTSQPLETVTLFDMQGKAWMQGRQKKLDVSALPSGMYVLTVELKGNTRLHQQKISIVHE